METTYVVDRHRPPGLASAESPVPMMSPAAYVKLRQMLGGAMSFVSGLEEQPRPDESMARYSYAVWLRHLALASRHGMTVPPKVVAELGPGRSVASGLAALLSGADTYICYEVEPHFDLDGALAELKELVELFRQRADLVAPSTSDVRPRLDSYHFPLEAVGGLHRLEQGLQPERVRAIRDALRRSAKGTAPTSAPVRIEYVTSWDRLAATLNHHPVDMVFSQAVMQYVEDVGQAYRHCFRWLRSGGWMSHQIDFSAHETACVWSGHWSYSDLVWRIIRGRKPFFLNRKPLSSHVDFARSAGFDLVAAVLTMDTNGIGRDELAPRFRHLTDQDLKTRSGFLLCRKP